MTSRMDSFIICSTSVIQTSTFLFRGSTGVDIGTCSFSEEIISEMVRSSSKVTAVMPRVRGSVWVRMWVGVRVRVRVGVRVRVWVRVRVRVRVSVQFEG